MLAPIDKIEADGNDILQIDVTTSCDRSCGNCTRLLEFRRDYKHMSVECFREAVRCSADWPGVLALFGGNPCAAPKFPEYCAILEEYVPEQARRGLWTNNLLKHGELVRRVFYPDGRFNLNAHADPKAAAEIERWLPGKIIKKSRNEPSWHGAILVDRRDYGVDDDTWVSLRENCDINQHWSGAIVERDGRPMAFFCEIASSLDGVRGENHGIPVEPGWWKWKMDRFENQVRQCCDRGCGVPLRLKGHLDRDEIYDMSPSWAGELGESRGAGKREVYDELPKETSRSLVDYLRLRSGR